jgi:hypothetical protein
VKLTIDTYKNNNALNNVLVNTHILNQDLFVITHANIIILVKTLNIVLMNVIMNYLKYKMKESTVLEIVQKDITNKLNIVKLLVLENMLIQKKELYVVILVFITLLQFKVYKVNIVLNNVHKHNNICNNTMKLEICVYKAANTIGTNITKILNNVLNNNNVMNKMNKMYN